MASSILPSTSSVATTIFRVRRKRSADPHEALLVSLKRPRGDPDSKSFGPVLYQLATTSEVPEVSTIGKMVTPGTQLCIIDFNPLKESRLVENDQQSCEMDEDLDPLRMLNDAVGEIGAPNEQPKKEQNQNQQFMLNGVPLVSVDSPSNESDGFVFDFYYNGRGIDYDADEMEVRLAKPDELELYAGEDTESSTGADDDDDSNREDNWRNDYPDEESGESSNTDTDDDPVFDSDSERCTDINRRLGGVILNRSKSDDDDRYDFE